ncbi:hypothetical protein CMI37_07205 [Candidatus Pacearchaeota archaeon]|nr:hypothetical protein [Candidatus Pacearchaeota archaeon]|tara:strand:+ start:910 stop:1887 length:978 start_codon:yes stop_codon:yes gene_type:complete
MSKSTADLKAKKTSKTTTAKPKAKAKTRKESSMKAKTAKKDKVADTTAKAIKDIDTKAPAEPEAPKWNTWKDKVLGKSLVTLVGAWKVRKSTGKDKDGKKVVRESLSFVLDKDATVDALKDLAGQEDMVGELVNPGILRHVPTLEGFIRSLPVEKAWAKGMPVNSIVEIPMTQRFWGAVSFAYRGGVNQVRYSLDMEDQVKFLVTVPDYELRGKVTLTQLHRTCTEGPDEGKEYTSLALVWEPEVDSLPWMLMDNEVTNLAVRISFPRGRKGSARRVSLAAYSFEKKDEETGAVEKIWKQSVFSTPEGSVFFRMLRTPALTITVG